MLLKSKPGCQWSVGLGWLIAGILCLAACGGNMATRTGSPQPQPENGNAIPTESLPSSLPVRGGNLRFEQLSVEEGLSESVVNVILQDSLGFLWFGTEDGLNLFDGYTLTVFKYDPSNPQSLSQNYITALCEDHTGKLWIGTLDNGLNQYDRSTGKFTRYQSNEADPSSLSNNLINAIFEDQQGNLWIGTNEGGLERFDYQTQTFLHYKNDPENSNSLSHNTVLAINQDRQGALWVGTALGLDRFDTLTGQFTHYQYNPDDPKSLSYNQVRAIFEDHLGSLWIGTIRGLDRFDQETGQFIHYQNSPEDSTTLSSNRVKVISEDQAGVLWIGTIGGGLNRFDRQTGRFTAYQYDPFDKYSLSDDRVLSLCADASGVLWVGTFGGGVNKLDQGYKQFVHYYNNPKKPDSLNRNLVYAIASDQAGMVWVGTDGGGLNQLDPKTDLFAHYLTDPGDPHSLSSNTVRALYVDENGVLWIGTAAGLNRLEPGAKQFTRYLNNTDDVEGLQFYNITAIDQDKDGFLWIGTEGNGLVKFDRKTGEFVEFYFNDPTNSKSLSSNLIWSVLIDSSNQVWAGTAYGLDLLDQATGQFTHYRSEPGYRTTLSDNYVMSIYESSTGTLWVGTTGGLNKYEPATGTFHQYRESNGLPNEYIYGILEDEQGFLWLSSNKGLSRFDPHAETFRNYDAKDGLQGNEFNIGAACKRTDGQMFFGGINGLTVFYPANIQDNPYVPPIVLTSFLAQGKEMAPQLNTNTRRDVTLRWPNIRFEFEFAALSYSQPERNQYAYMLQGFDKSWNNIGSRHIGQYTNLPGGNYTLRLKGTNNDGLWNEQGIAIKIKVIPPFWNTWLFRGAAVLLVVTGVLAGYRLRVQSIQLRNQELKRQVHERTSELEQRNIEIARLFEQAKELAVIEERGRLARDLHDSAKQKAFAALAQLGAANGIIEQDPPSAKRHLVEAENLVYDVLQEMIFLIQELYPAALKEQGLVTALREYAFEWENRNDNIGVALKLDDECSLSLQAEQALYRITQEALANIARHSHASQVKISLNYRPEVVELVIEDNGYGYDPQRVISGLGLHSMQERVAMIHGELSINSAPGKGTRIIVDVPLDNRSKGG